MTPQRWARMKEIFGTALEKSESERPAYLDSACHGDSELRAEVERLLAEGDATSLRSPAGGLLSAARELAPGDTVAHYRIEARLGEGGMGVVYKARDTRLDRFVAIKLLQARDQSDEDRIRRFTQEARTASGLNHANIITIYEIATHDGAPAIVMEYVSGKSLDHLIPRNGMRLGELLKIAGQIAGALAAAASAGIIHRDIKPGNVMVNDVGNVKVLDFGLAKLHGRAPSADQGTMTTDRPRTREGAIVGTASYMSPEQAEGKAVDPRSDIFSFGAVLYEMATGQRAFRGDTMLSTLSAILRDEPKPVRQIATDNPRDLENIITRCLRKDPERRFQNMADVRVALLELKEESESGTLEAVPAAARKPNGRHVIAAIGLAVALGSGLATLLPRPAPADPSHYKFTPIVRDETTKEHPAWSPDGKSIAYEALIHGVPQVFIKALGAPDAAQITHGPDSCNAPFWSPDGAKVYYTSHGSLWSVGVSGGAPTLVMKGAGIAPALHPDGRTLVIQARPKLLVRSLDGGKPRVLEQSPDNAELVKFSPDGSRIAVVAGPGDLWILPFPSGAPRNLGRAGSQFVSWFPDSRHIVTGNPDEVSVFAIVDTNDGSRRVIHRSAEPLLGASVSPDGKKIAYYSAALAWDVVEISLPKGRVHTMPQGGAWTLQPEWAPSGTHYLVSTSQTFDGNRVIEDRSATEGFSRRVAEQPPGATHWAAAPRWSPDGTRFLFLQRSPERKQLMLSSASGGGVIPLTDLDDVGDFAWSPDGQWIVLTRGKGGRQRLVKMKLVPGATEVLLEKAAPAATVYSVIQWSPTGEWIAYPSAEGVSMVSPDGNTSRKLTARNLLAFAFSEDGAQVYGIVRNTSGEGAEWQLSSTDVKTGVDKPLAALELHPSVNQIAGFSLHPDGKRFLTSVAKWPFDIWMLEGFDPPLPKTWLDRLLRR